MILGAQEHLKIDEIGYWSEVKLDIIREYASAYSQILAAQRNPRLSHYYIDGFAGPGYHISRQTHEFVRGSPLNALSVVPPFAGFFLIDLDGQRVDTLKEAVSDRSDVHVLQGDCNEVLLTEVFPNIKYEEYRRGLCLLDPYGLHLDWKVLQTAGKMRSIEVFLNFPVMDMNRNVLHKDSQSADPKDAERMTRFWGDESWRKVGYRTEPTLFGDISVKNENEVLASAFRQRLRTVAGFSHVPRPVPMKNNKGATVYYLFFAAHKPVASHIVTDIFKKYMNPKK